MFDFLKNNYNKIILILLFSFFIFISIWKYTNAVSSDISNSVFRLHIIANSDSEADQNLKLKVRDSILNYINENTSQINSKDDVISFINSHQYELKKLAINTVKNEGFDYDVSIEIGNFYFPTKDYGNVKFPAGNYDGLRIKIGKAEGKNWWCVMFPPLCLIDNSTCKMESDSLKLLEENLTKEEFSIISSSSPDIKFKFKLIELFNR